jgi:hypothetical protein
MEHRGAVALVRCEAGCREGGNVRDDLKSLDRRAADRLDRERPVIVYCYDYQ